MTQHTYDNESVQELLNWAKKMLETKNYPTEKYELNKCTTIIKGQRIFLVGKLSFKRIA